jgi:hypothetical protein
VSPPRPEPRSRLYALPGVLLSIALFEVVTRLLLAQPTVWAALTELGDTGREIAAVQRLRALDPDANDFSERYPVAWHPRYGWTSRPGRFVEDGHTIMVSAQGLRADRTFSEQPAPDHTRLLFFGDSFGFGTDVGDEQTYVAALDRPGLELLNLSVVGHGHDQMLLRLREEGLPLHPDLVVLVFVSCDVPRNAQSFTTWAKPGFELEDGRLQLHGVPMPTVAERLAAFDGRPRGLDLLRLLAERWGQPAEAERANQLTLALLEAFTEEVHAAGAVPVVLHAPILGEWEVRPDDPRFDAFAARGLVGRFCRETRHAACLDAFAAFHRAHLEGVPLQTGTHWSPEGHQIVASTLAGWLDKRGMGSDETSSDNLRSPR